jgi:hypothetical protein
MSRSTCVRCEAANYDPNAGHQMRIRIQGIFENCLEGDGLESIIRDAVPADNNALARPLVSAHTGWDEDWQATNKFTRKCAKR